MTRLPVYRFVSLRGKQKAPADRGFE